MFSWPLQVKRAKVTAGFEGLPRRIGVYQASTRVDAREVFLFVFFPGFITVPMTWFH